MSKERIYDDMLRYTYTSIPLFTLPDNTHGNRQGAVRAAQPSGRKRSEDEVPKSVSFDYEFKRVNYDKTILRRY